MSTRSILISYAGYPYTFNSLMPDNGLANLAGALLSAGHETLILDYGTVENVRRMVPKEVSCEAKSTFLSLARKMEAGEELGEEQMLSLSKLERTLADLGNRHVAKVAEEICEEIERFEPHFVGFKLWNGDGFSGSIKIAQKVRAKHKNVRIFGGGPHVDIFRGDIYRATNAFDCLAYGEGEKTILELSEFALGRRRLEDVNNIVFKNGVSTILSTRTERIRDLITLPLPCYEEQVYPAMKGNNKIKIMVLDESRGCSFACHFCIHPYKSGRGLRTKKASRIIEEMRWITQQTGSRAFRYAGSSTPPGLAKELAELIISEDLNVRYAGFGNPLNAVPEYFQVLSDSGCRALAFGMESGSELILKKALGKSIKVERMREVLEASKRAGIFTVVGIIFPAPFETKETEEETLAFLREVRPDSALVLFPAIYPRTKWATDKKKFGFVFDEAEYLPAAMNYKVKTLFPMDFWDDLPYSLGERDFRTMMNETARFTRTLEREGITTSVCDDLALMASLAGYRGEEKTLGNLGRFWFFTGDAHRIQELVDAVNSNASAGSE